MKKLILLLLFMLPIVAFAQKNEISQVVFYRDQEKVVISYLLSVPKINAVRVYMNTEKGSRLLRNVSGDVGRVWGKGYKEIIFDITSELGSSEIPEDATFTVVGRKINNNYTPLYGAFEYIYSYSAPIGMGFAYFSKWGGYGRFKFSFLSSEIGYPDYDYSPDEAVRRYYRQAFTAGLVRLVYKNAIWVYGGLGYGIYAPVDRVDYTTEYGTRLTDYFWNKEKVRGLELELGLMFRLGGFYMSVGYGGIAGEKMPFWPNVSVGMGYSLEF